MGFIGKATANTVRKFGVVTEGKHQGCIMTMDNGAGRGGKVTFSQIAFFEGEQEQGRYIIREDLQAVHYVTFEVGGLMVQLEFKSGETCTCKLLIIKSDGFFTTLLKGFTGESETYEQRQNRLYSNVTNFFASTLGLIQSEDLHKFSEFFRHSYLFETDPALKKMVDEYKELCEEE